MIFNFFLFITDSLGIPISVLIDEGCSNFDNSNKNYQNSRKSSRCDSKILLVQLKSKFLINKKING